MKVIVKFFATYREAAGEKQVELEVEDGTSLGGLLENIVNRYPKLRKWADSIICSINRKYAGEDTILKEEDEVALLPPVSGGSRLTDKDIQIEDMLTSLKSEKAGAVVFFVGVVRKDPGVESITVEAYPEMADERLEELVRESKNRFDIEGMEIVHRTGDLAVGENIVVIGASASHRKDAFRACEWAIDELKKIVPIWKKDEGGWVGTDG